MCVCGFGCKGEGEVRASRRTQRCRSRRRFGEEVLAPCFETDQEGKRTLCTERRVGRCSSALSRIGFIRVWYVETDGAAPFPRSAAKAFLLEGLMFAPAMRRDATTSAA